MSAHIRKFVSASVLLVVLGPAAAQDSQRPALEADSASFNTRTGRGEFVRGVITFGDLTITADAGSYVDNVEWRLDGDVVLTHQDMRVEADSLVGEYSLGSFEMSGNPITFEGTNESGQTARGQTDRLVYDGTTEEVALLGRSRLRVGPYEFRGCDIRYGLTDGDVSTGEQCEERFELTSEPEDIGGLDGAAPPSP